MPPGSMGRTSSADRPLPPLSTLRAARLAACLKQDELAAASGVSRSVISTAERAPHLLTTEAAGKLAAALGLAPEYLLARPAR